MALFKRFQYYRRALQGLLIFNIIVVSAGLVAALGFYGSKKALIILAEQNTQRLQALDDIHRDIILLSTISIDSKDPYFYHRHLEDLKERLEAWPDSNLAQIALPKQVSNEKLPSKVLYEVYERVSKEQKNLRDQLSLAPKKLAV
jgi:hypothetical protein